MTESTPLFFSSYAARHQIPASERVDLLLGFIEDLSLGEALVEYLTVLESEVTPEQPPETVVAPWEPQPPEQTVAELTNFFDRDLTKQILKHLTHMIGDGPVFEEVGYETVRLRITAEELELTKAILANKEPLDGCADGEIIHGWYYVFADGAIAAIALTNAQEPYIDAVLIQADSAPAEVPNDELDPIMEIPDDEDVFVFNAVDDVKVVRLVTTPL